jgi:hypothetical protein
MRRTHRKGKHFLINVAFWHVALCRSWVNERFGGTYCLHFQGRKIRERGTSVSRWLQIILFALYHNCCNFLKYGCLNRIANAPTYIRLYFFNQPNFVDPSVSVNVSCEEIKRFCMWTCARFTEKSLESWPVLHRCVCGPSEIEQTWSRLISRCYDQEKIWKYWSLSTVNPR